jgi:hypothetical protein
MSDDVVKAWQDDGRVVDKAYIASLGLGHLAPIEVHVKCVDDEVEYVDVCRYDFGGTDGKVLLVRGYEPGIKHIPLKNIARLFRVEGSC